MARFVRRRHRLDGLTGGIVEVVALLPKTSTPPVELLAYRSPHGRTPARLDPDDIAATRLVFETDTAETTILRHPDGHLLEPQPVLNAGLEAA